MPGIDDSLDFHPLNIAVLTISDTRTPETDTSGGLLVERLTVAGHRLAGRALVHVKTFRPERVRIRVYDISGALVSTPVNTKLEAGVCSFPLDGFKTGLFLLKVDAGDRFWAAKTLMME